MDVGNWNERIRATLVLLVIILLSVRREIMYGYTLMNFQLIHLITVCSTLMLENE